MFSHTPQGSPAARWNPCHPQALVPESTPLLFGLCLPWHTAHCTARVRALRLQNLSQHFQLLPGQCKALQSLAQTKQISPTQIENPWQNTHPLLKDTNSFPESFKYQMSAKSSLEKDWVSHTKLVCSHAQQLQTASRQQICSHNIFLQSSTPECLDTGTVPIVLNLTL